MKNSIFKDREFLRKTLVLTLPLAGQSVLSTLMHLISSIIIGKLGDQIIATNNVATNIYGLFSMMISGCITGAVILQAQYWGRKDSAAIRKLMTVTIYLAVFFSAVGLLAVHLIPEKLIMMYTKDTGLLEYGISYLQMLSYSLLPFGLSTAIIMAFSSMGRVKVGFQMELMNSILSTLLGIMLVHGFGGIPAYGLIGYAYAQMISRVLCFAFSVWYLFKNDSVMEYRLKDLAILPEKELLWLYIRTDYPVFASDTLMMLVSMIQTIIAGRVSTEYITANSIVHNIWMTAALFGMGCGKAAAIIIGNSVGAGDLEEAQNLAEKYIQLSGIIALSVAVTIYIIAEPIIGRYVISEAANETVHDLITPSAITAIITMYQLIIGHGVVRAGGQVRETTAVELLAAFLVSLPAGWLAACKLQLSPALIYIILRLDKLITAIWALIKVRKKRWIKNLLVTQ